MDMLLKRFVDVCNEKGLGYRDQDFWLPVMALTDHVWLFAKNTIRT